jgi:hypothetical protein
MGARSYLPTLGRFLQVDPIDGGSANPYDYAFQDPLNTFDLDGRCVWGKTVCRLASYFAKVKSLVPESKFVRDIGLARRRITRVLKSPGGRKVGKLLSGASCAYGLSQWKKDGVGDHFFTAISCAGFFTAVLAA